jgi:hypothetical protein
VTGSAVVATCWPGRRALLRRVRPRTRAARSGVRLALDLVFTPRSSRPTTWILPPGRAAGHVLHRTETRPEPRGRRQRDKSPTQPWGMPDSTYALTAFPNPRVCSRSVSLSKSHTSQPPVPAKSTSSRVRPSCGSKAQVHVASTWNRGPTMGAFMMPVAGVELLTAMRRPSTMSAISLIICTVAPRRPKTGSGNTTLAVVPTPSGVVLR